MSSSNKLVDDKDGTIINGESGCILSALMSSSCATSGATTPPVRPSTPEAITKALENCQRNKQIQQVFWRLLHAGKPQLAETMQHQIYTIPPPPPLPSTQSSTTTAVSQTAVSQTNTDK